MQIVYFLGVQIAQFGGFGSVGNWLDSETWPLNFIEWLSPIILNR